MANKLCSSRWSVVSTEDQFRIPEYLLRFHLIPARVFTYGRTDRHHEAFPYDSLSYFRRKVKSTRKRQWQEKIFMEDCQTFRSIYFYTYPFCSNNLGMHIRSTERSQTTGLFRIYFPLWKYTKRLLFLSLTLFPSGHQRKMNWPKIKLFAVQWYRLPNKAEDNPFFIQKIPSEQHFIVSIKTFSYYWNLRNGYGMGMIPTPFYQCTLTRDLYYQNMSNVH